MNGAEQVNRAILSTCILFFLFMVVLLRAIFLCVGMSLGVWKMQECKLVGYGVDTLILNVRYADKQGLPVQQELDE